MRIETEHKIVGKKLSELGDLDIGSLYPVVDENLEHIVGVFSAEYGEPDGYKLSEKLQAFVPFIAGNQLLLNPLTGAVDTQESWYADCKLKNYSWSDWSEELVEVHPELQHHNAPKTIVELAETLLDDIPLPTSQVEAEQWLFDQLEKRGHSPQSFETLSVVWERD